MNESLDNQKSVETNKKPEVQERLERVFEESIGTRLEGAKKFRRGSSQLILLMVKMSLISFDDLKELHRVMRECLESSELKDQQYKKIVKEEYDILWPGERIG